jgi:hypothetical protein
MAQSCGVFTSILAKSVPSDMELTLWTSQPNTAFGVVDNVFA